MIPIPPAVREVMYKYRWDKLLVDIKRTVDMTSRGKKEHYSAMVAVGNLQVGTESSLRGPESEKTRPVCLSVRIQGVCVSR